MDDITLWYTSVGGIVLVTVLIVNGIKKYAGGVRVLMRVPTWAYVLATATALTEFAHAALGTLAHGPNENDLQLITKAVTLALVASGAQGWMTSFNKPISSSTAAIAKREGVSK